MASLGEATRVRTSPRRSRGAARPAGTSGSTIRRYSAACSALLVAASVPLLWVGVSAEASVAALALAVLIALSAIDIASRIVPNAIVLPAAAVVLLAHVAADRDRWLEWVLASVGTAGFLFVAAVVGRGSIGMGDVKLGLLLGATLGYDVYTALMVGTTAAACYGLMLIARHGRESLRTTIPYVPFLALGAAVVVLWGGGWPGGFYS